MRNISKALFILVLTIWIVLILDWNASAEGTGDYPAPENGDWFIYNETHVWNETIVLNGNLTLNNSSKLTFDNITLKMNCTKNGEFKIKIKKGGEFYGRNNSNITGIYANLFYKFEVYGKMQLNNCEISHLWGWEESYDVKNFTGGIEIYSNNVSISNCSITSFSKVAINCKSSRIKIENTTIQQNSRYFMDSYGIICENSDLEIYNNTISEAYHGIYSKHSNMKIFGNRFSYDSAIFCSYGNIKIIENIFIGSHRSIHCYYNNVTIMNNNLNGVEITLCDYAYVANNIISSDLEYLYGISGFESNLTVENNRITVTKSPSLISVGISIYNEKRVKSQGIIRRNHISGTKRAIVCHNATILENVLSNNEKAISFWGGSSIIQKNIFDNNDEAIFSDSTTLQISENQFTNNKIGIHAINSNLDIYEIKFENDFKNSEFIIWQERRLKINVKYSNGTITENATIVIRDINGKKVWNGTTNQYGIGTIHKSNISTPSLTEYKLSINGDELRFSPYNISVEKDNITNWTEIIIDENSEEITIVLTTREIVRRKTKEESNLWLPFLLVGLLFALIFISSINFYRSSTKHNTIQDFKLPDIYNKKQFKEPSKRKPPPLIKNVQPQKCPYCRSEIPGDLKICNNCGERIKI